MEGPEHKLQVCSLVCHIPHLVKREHTTASTHCPSVHASMRKSDDAYFLPESRRTMPSMGQHD